MEAESEKHLWAQSFPMAEPMKDALGRLVEESHDDAETEYYDDFADPTFVAVESSQRRYRGMLNRRMRHLRSRGYPDR
ncbi:MAG: hypothetical protein ABSF84_00485 [Acidimicrobiales bacterium]|jgi:hypothetical protein